ncbi:MAG: transketolase family protein [Deltaproteobacteria bacterium]|nr:transketolase family protein [Deltaproteobacteria bacterium]
MTKYLKVNPSVQKASRTAFGETLVHMGEKHPEIVVLDADLSVSTKSAGFAKKFPDRFFHMGIAEANMIGTAAGLALSGKTPFLCSFGCFVAGRFETIRISIAYNQVNARIMGTHAGLGIGEDGYTQMALEDIALMRSLPGMGVLQPGDPVETRKMIEYLSSHHKGPVYVRLTRQNLVSLFSEDYEFEYGKGVVLKEGKDIALLATGGVVYNSYVASQTLEKEGISSTVINIHTLKPIEEELIVHTAKSHKRLVTVEDHNIIGGLGSAVSEVLAENGIGTPLLRIGVEDIYGESGTAENLYEKYGLSINKIYEKTLQFFQESNRPGR